MLKRSLSLTFASHPLRVKGHIYHKVNVACSKNLIITRTVNNCPGKPLSNKTQKQKGQNLQGNFQMPCVFS